MKPRPTAGVRAMTSLNKTFLRFRPLQKQTALVACILGLCAANPARAATINVNYSYSGTGSGDPMNPPLIGIGTGSMNPLGSMAWMDIITHPNLATGQADGTFSMTFNTGDTLFGTLHEQLNLAAAPIVPFTQVLIVTGGTGALRWYHGTLIGNGTVNLADFTFSASGSGTLNTVPEPGSIVFLGTGLACLLVCRKRGLLFR